MGKTVVVTGASRGIGLGLAETLKGNGFHVVALCRESSDELEALGVQVIDEIDIGQDDCVEKIQAGFQEGELFALFNNAGVMQRQTLRRLDLEVLNWHLQVNSIGPLRVTKALLPHLKKGSKIINITSRMGSIEDNTSGGVYGYRMSKAALNMASVSLARDLHEKEIAVGIVHPGFVRTEMTNHKGLLTVSESVQGILARFEELNLENSGTFWHVNGEVLPW